MRCNDDLQGTSDSQRVERRVGMAEFCHRLNIKSRSTIYAHVKAGLIQKPSRLGRRFGWPSSYVDELVR